MDEIICVTTGCPLLSISWLFYAISVIVVFALGAFWYGKLFSEKWVKAQDYTCICGARLAEGEKCTCKSHSLLPMVMQFIATALVGMMYFLLAGFGCLLSIVVMIGVAAWMKAGLKFRISEWKRFVNLVIIDVGYFCLASIIFIIFAKL